MAAPKRGQILNAALGLFEAKGYGGTAVPEIAQAAGVAVGTIYRYFPTKEALVRALLADCQTRFEADVLAPVPPTATPRATFRLYWRRMAQFARSFPVAYRFLDLHDHAAYRDPSAAPQGEALTAALRDLVARGRREGAMKALDPTLVMALLRGALAGLARHASPDGVLPPARVEEMEDCLWNAVAARG
ncbi:MAG: TetR/AcrR family transcriptional regulator [Alphaproteobacteria bacterium]|nr:TetR/AcrR family transcriptional regulator [Alphaproteobacteria bacterium]